MTVYIGVAGAGSNSTYSVRAHEVFSAASRHPPSLLTLLDGEPQVQYMCYLKTIN